MPARVVLAFIECKASMQDLDRKKAHGEARKHKTQPA
jgi:hypothetical protein